MLYDSGSAAASCGLNPAASPLLVIGDRDPSPNFIPQVFSSTHVLAGGRSRKQWRQCGYKVRKGAKAVAIHHAILDAPASGRGREVQHDPVAIAEQQWREANGLGLAALTPQQERQAQRVRKAALGDWLAFVAAFREEVTGETWDSITDAQFNTYLLLLRAGHVAEIPLYAIEDCDRVTLDDLNLTEAWEVLLTDFYRKGSHHAQFIVKYQDAAGVWRAGTVGTGRLRMPWNPAMHRKGQAHLGVKAGRRTSFLAVDFDRHSGTVKGRDQERRVMETWDHVTTHYRHMAPLLEVNEDNGSVKLYLHFNDFVAVDDEAQAFIGRLRQELPFLMDVEVYPCVEGPGRCCTQIFLPLRNDKISICDQVVPRVRSVKYDLNRHSTVYQAYDARHVLKWLADPDRRLADRGLVLGVLRRAIANLDDEDADNGGVVPRETGRPARTRGKASSKAGDLPPWKGCTACRLVGFLNGDEMPPDDTLDELVVVLLRVLYHMGWSEEDAVEWVEDAVGRLPDTSFSDRLTNDLAEWQRNLRQSAARVWDGNGGQPDPRESSRKLFEMLACWAARGFDITDRSTWGRASEASPRRRLPVCWTAPLDDLLLGFMVVLKTRDEDAARRLFESVASQVEVRKQLAVSYFRLLMKEVGIPGGMDKAKAARDFLEARGVLRLFKRSFNDKASGTRRGSLYVLGSLVRFRSGEEARLGPAGLLLLGGSPHHTPGSIYPSSSGEVEEELLMERRRLSAERWYDSWLRKSYRREQGAA